jgi:hypothetical protein
MNAATLPDSALGWSSFESYGAWGFYFGSFGAERRVDD